METINMLVFVYGTLKKGYHNNILLTNAEFLGTHVTEPFYTMYSYGGFPAVAKEGSTRIHGEVYRIPAVLQASLDNLEQCPNWYVRERINTLYGEAWIYFMPKERLQPNAEIITSGKWE